MGGDEGQIVEFTQGFLIKPASGLIFLNEAKCENDEIVQIDS